MNAVRRNAFTSFLEGYAGALGTPRALLVVSAHWESTRLAASTAERPATLHDFHGFPPELYALRYPAPGAPNAARRALALLRSAGFEAEEAPRQGLDHGAWSPLLRLLPGADVPVAQLSLSFGAPLARHLEIGRALSPLRDEGVLLIGSGNVVHNLRTVDFGSPDAPAEPWARQVDDWVREAVLRDDPAALARLPEQAPHGRLAHPTSEHYAPLLVAAGAAGAAARPSFPFEGFEHATLSMRCVRWD